jgi:hypothetical protein
VSTEREIREAAIISAVALVIMHSRVYSMLNHPDHFSAVFAAAKQFFDAAKTHTGVDLLQVLADFDEPSE